MQTNRLLQEWETARKDLGLEIVAPYEVNLGSDKTVNAQVLVRNFGAEKGTLIVTDYAQIEPHAEQLCQLGYGYSVLEEPTEPYNREVFINMLSEWEWVGDSSRKPSWVRDVPPES